MSDNIKIRSLSGNLHNRWDEPGAQIRYRGPHRLVEECESISIRDVQRGLGKKAVVLSIRQSRPLRLHVLGGHFDVFPVDESHRLPGGPERWSSVEDGNCRFWLICPGCRRKVRKLFYFYLGADSLGLSDLLCQRCHSLVYQSQNCGGNRWYQETACPPRGSVENRPTGVTSKPANGGGPGSECFFLPRFW